MPIVKNRSTEQNRRFWSHVEEVAREADVLVSRESREPHEDSRGDERPMGTPQRCPDEKGASRA